MTDDELMKTFRILVAKTDRMRKAGRLTGVYDPEYHDLLGRLTDTRREAEKRGLVEASASGNSHCAGHRNAKTFNPTRGLRHR